VIGLLYAWLLVDQAVSSDRGTPRMQDVAAALREMAEAYLSAQFRKIVPLMVLVTFLPVLTRR
jgi:K(+)-stimulated pyrophosphate-energized sodium pump